MTGERGGRPGPDTWLGFPRHPSESEVERTIDLLTEIWVTQMNREPGPLDEDLQSLKVLFDPIARGSRLRSRLNQLPPTTVERELLLDPFVLPVNDRASLIITPEGRQLLDVLVTARAGTDAPFISSSVIARAESRLLDLYRAWSQQRLRDVIRLQEGEAPALLPQAAGQVLLLLINRSTTPERAVIRPNTQEDLRRLDDSLSLVVEAFADTLSPPASRQRNRAQYSIIGGYSLSEARRRLGESLVIDGGRIYLDDAKDQVTERIARELARRHDIDAARLVEAFDAMVAEYEQVRPVLAGFGQSHSRPSTTRELRQNLLDHYQEHRSALAEGH